MSSSAQQQQTIITANRDVRKELGNYVFGKTLGEGTFGKVKLATHKATGEMVAVKILEKDKILDVADVQRVSRQIHILKLVRHPNIIQLYEIIETPKQLFLVMEYIENGELFHYIVRNKRLPEEQACKMYHELISGIEYIHRLNIVHRDLKPENLLLDFNHSLKLVDFGLSNTYHKDETLKTPCGSPCYAAPEMIKGERYNGLRVDIWSSGVILFAMLCGCLPFEDNDTNKLYKKILLGKYNIASGLSEHAKDLLARVLTVDPEKRYTIDQIRSHEWMSGKDIVTNPGLIVGYNRIPVDRRVVEQTAQALNVQPDYTVKCIQANRHNSVTTAYYLMFKKFIKSGGSSAADMSSSAFDRSLTEPNRRTEAPSKQKHPLVILQNKENMESANCQKDIDKLSKLEIAIPIRKKNEVEMSSKYSSTRPQESTRKSISKERSRGELRQRSTVIVLDKKKLPLGSHQLSSKELQPSQPKARHPVSVTSQHSRINRHYREEFNKSLVSRSRDKQRSSVSSVQQQRLRVVSINSTKQRAQSSVSRQRAISHNNRSENIAQLGNVSRTKWNKLGEDARKAMNTSVELKHHKRNRSTQLKKHLNQSFTGLRNGEAHYKRLR